MPATPAKPLQPLKGVRILSLALNLPGPAGLMRCRAMGARCVKLEPPPHPAAPQGTTGDPMSVYMRTAYDAMHQGVKMLVADLKTDRGRAALHRELQRSDVLITSFRPSALTKLGLDWKALHKAYPQLNVVAVFGGSGALAEEPGHDLTYQAENDLLTGLDLPATLYADMGGSLLVSEAVLQARLQQLQKGRAVRLEVSLSDAAAWLGLPRSWGLMAPTSMVGGGHAGYRIYPCKDGRVALAALEPHFAAALGAAMGLADASLQAMLRPETQVAVAAFVAGKTRKQLDALALAKDIPLHTLK
ncbi:CoA transferase [Rhodoferax lacus]|uniref:CoA transferase n=1 Tax=Rhodoferax lacus TaxID=2184758 RepID=A0A3E1RHN8_9BURK|nr:CoA transferase [Rhodoferax lacus]RFO98522.1 CoA transferase [Rhodoferax lacus]